MTIAAYWPAVPKGEPGITWMLEPLARIVLFAVGGIIAGMLIGVYFLLSMTWFGAHGNEVFSSLQNIDYKCFLRMKLDGDELVIFPIGVRRVPRPGEPALAKCELIEPPIRLK
jgi:hypothetical protein